MRGMERAFYETVGDVEDKVVRGKGNDGRGVTGKKK